jgi:aryl-alcohol dehydrogenase-like predicted oxidoreductase
VEYRTLGRTGVKVSSYCLGAMMFGPWGNEDEDECVRMVHAALDGGINFVDTADVYGEGRSEEIVGKALEGRRDDVVLATKVHGQMGKGPNERGNSRLWIMREVEASLRRLQTDHIDLYQIHRPDPDTDIEETLSALTDLVRQGKVRYLGSSTFPAWQLVEAHRVSERRSLERFACEQPPYSILVRQIELDVLPVAQRYGMGVIVWSPLAGGWLSGKYRRGQDAPDDSRAVRFRRRGSPVARRFDLSVPENQRKLDLVEDLTVVADKAGLSLTHMAMAFALAHPGVTSAIIGPRTPAQLQDLLEGADVDLDAEVLDAIDELVPPGGVVFDFDRGWSPPWREPAARRRQQTR